MAILRIEEDDTVPTRLLQQLSQTAYACSSLSPPLSSRDGNAVYRGALTKPIQDGTTVESIIIKYTTDSVPRIFEELLLKTLASFSPPHTINTVAVKTPYYLLTENFLPSPSAASIGHRLGFWLRSFHNWTSAPEQAALRAHMGQNDHVRKTKYLLTYESISKVFEIYPGLSDGHENTLEALRDVIANDLERPFTDETDDYGILHGDFWSGKWELLQEVKTTEIFIIDWEFAQFGHRSTDLGQIVGDLYERKVYNNLENAMSAMEGVIEGYGVMSDEMAFRTAIYLGVHLISYYNRRPQKGPRVASPEVILAGLTVGRDFIVKGLQKDGAFFQDSALASLFAAR
ncbi:conserved hypothetical protein [Talaromyces stipitatus ATCC 10500]|uniref:Aminoglycoside phosphotransferase domain-containing protein n=1 Tax=Talaromyces stipitatus (strain ATCC 10500 / CBS 375.48 / QM 6759 / NRRL 1006) TaxID=441959 RepID=B8M2V2_TALSN|nr:uncharacterized protein TSTA_094530 [Talaromyces stipitatus ATCC 10500]EED22207.1 conserved hypothetical protein [Talaromyces stipitatus ATCC 10500]